MQEIEKNVNFMFEMVEGFKREREEKIKRYMEELKERFLKNHPVHVEAQKGKLQEENQENERTSKRSKMSRREEQLALGPSDKENDSSIETSVTKSSRRAREEPNPEPEIIPALRPMRMAKLNANKNLREPLLSNKMRQPGSNEMLLEVKKESLEEPEIKRERRTKRKIKHEKASDVPQEAVQMKSKDRVSKKDSSVELVASNEAEVVELSDGEADKMPPPALPMRKTRRARTKKAVAETSSASSSQWASGESHSEDSVTGEAEEKPVVEYLSKSSIPPVPMNATFDVAKENEKEAEPEAVPVVPANSSLMTEDNSNEVPIFEPKKVPQKRKLNNPCDLSLLQIEMEAFERQAAASALPIVKETCSHVSQAPRLAVKSASTSKLTDNLSQPGCGVQKQSKTSTQSASKTRTRSASAEDNKRGLNALQLLAEEKRKKREERHKQAQQAREMREREKEERHRRLMMEHEEREERIKASKAKQLQEQEQKNRVMKAKESSRWGFDMLHTDDSTDDDEGDEDKKSNKRPPPPSWSVNPSLREQMDAQELVNSRFMDKFFMAKPMSVNLKEIFPDIDPDRLKRKSSVVWKTPPRFSQMPSADDV